MENEPAVELSVALDKVRHQITSNLANQKRPAALLVALESTLNDQGTALAPVAYFAGLLTALQQLLDGQSQDTDGETLPAALYLFAIVLPTVQPAVIRSKMGTLLESISPLLSSQHGQAAAIKSLVTIMQYVYLSMDGSTLNSLIAKQAFNVLLALTVDSRPKVRRKAQDTVASLLRNPPAPSVKHPYASRTADFVVESLKEALREGKKGGKRKMQDGQQGGAASEEASRAIALCAFVKSIGKDWPADAIASLCSLLLSLPRLGNTFLTEASYDILETLFSKSSDSFEEGKVEETLEAVLAARPSGTGSVDERILPGWLGTVEHGFVAYAKINPEGCKRALISTFNGVLTYLANPAQPVRTAATSTLTGLIRYCIPNDEIEYATSHANDDESDHPLHAMCNSLLGAIKNIKYQALGMPHVLTATSALVSRLRTKVDGRGGRVPAASLLLKEHVAVTGHLRGLENFEYRDAAELVISSATEVCGPQWVLALLPLNLDSNQENGGAGRAWLLPIFKSSITNTRLKHFVDDFLPLCERMYAKFQDAESRSENADSEAGRKRAGIEAKIYEAIIQQIWALFPGYCDLPVDLKDAFTKSLLDIISNVLYEQPHLRPPIFRGLQLLVERSKTLTQSGADSATLIESFGLDAQKGQENLKFLSGLAPGLLAVMFNVFSKAGKEGRGFILDCISAYLGILTTQDVIATYRKIRKLLTDTLQAGGNANSGSEAVTHTMLDLLVQLVPFLPDPDTAGNLLELALSPNILQSKDTAVQKKAYRLLVRFCESGGAAGQSVIRSNLTSMLEHLFADGYNVASSAKKDRGILLATIVPLLPKDQLHLLPTIIPEAVLATKEANEQARGAAYDLLVEMGKKMLGGGVIKRGLVKGGDADDDQNMTDEAEASIQEYITMVAAGLAGQSPHMISATITALSRLLFEFNEQIPAEIVNELFVTILVFLSSANREIVKSSIGFVKVAIVCLSPVMVRPHLPKLVPALLDWSHEHKNHFKMNIRHIFERLVRKFGFEEIDRLTGESDKKLLNNIRKRQKRAQRKREERQTNGDASEEDRTLRPRQEMNAYEEALYGSEEEDAMSDDDVSAKPTRPVQGQKQKQKVNAIGRKRGQETNEQYIREDGDEPLDLLDEGVLGRVSRKDPVAVAAERERRAQGRTGKTSGVRTDAKTGKLIFGVKEEEDSRAQRGVGDVEMDSTNAYLEAIRGEDGMRRDARGKVKFNKPTKRQRAQEEEDDLVEDVKDRLADLGVVAGQRPKKQKKQKEAIGQEFKAKKAGGDVKKNGGPNPYAYVPLTGKGRKYVSIVNKGSRKQ